MIHTSLLRSPFFFIIPALIALSMVMIYYYAIHYRTPYIDQLKSIKPKNPLKHMGIIMDGNRRWARKHGYKPWIGHQKGVAPVKLIIKFCIENKIPYLSLYVFSLENFNRPEEELSYLFDVLAEQISEQELNNLFQEGVKVTFAGDKNLFPEKIRPLIEEIETKTRRGTTLHLQLLFCYGGQQEIVDACKKIAQKCASGQMQSEDITTEIFRNHLWNTIRYEPDIIIRTAGDQRLSNFLTWSSAYSELVFLPCLWPDITQEMLARVVVDFYTIERRFGK